MHANPNARPPRPRCQAGTAPGARRLGHSTPPPAPIATTRDRHGAPLQVNWGGVFFRREEDQERAIRHRLADTIRARLEAIGADASELAGQLVDLTLQELVEDQDELLRRIGLEVLMANGRGDLWQLAYLQINVGNQYVLGDEIRFLLHEPRAGVGGDID